MPLEGSTSLQAAVFRGSVPDPFARSFNEKKWKDVLSKCSPSEVCTLFPVEVSDEFFFQQKIVEADKQLTRKVDFLRRNIELLREMHPSLQNLKSDPRTVSGIIVTNFLGGPAPFATHPVSAREFLAAYFATGESWYEVISDKRSVEVNSELVVRYYDSFETFRRNFFRYVHFAPHVRSFGAMVHRFENRMPFQELNLRDVIVQECEVVVPSDDGDRRRIMSEQARELRALLRS